MHKNSLPQNPPQNKRSKKPKPNPLKLTRGNTLPPRKKCFQCSADYPRDIAHFYPNEATLDGLTWMCIPCYDKKVLLVR